MRITRTHITNFRCLETIEIGFDDVTTFIGPNGVGKSTVLRALDWFFNGNALVPEDVSATAPEGSPVAVEVCFTRLTTDDRAAISSLGLDDPGEEWSVTRRWRGEGGPVTVAGALSFTGFEEIRAAQGATPARRLYNALREARPELDLPTAANHAAVNTALRTWETQHPEELIEGEVQISHPFGFGETTVFSGLFDYVLVDADLRAEEQAVDNRGSLINRILAHQVDRGPVGAAFGELADDASARHGEIVSEHLDPLLAEVSEALSNGLRDFTHSRAIKLRGSAAAMTPAKPLISLSIDADGTETTVDRQGHGFRRALLIALLRFLASSDDENDHTVVLAIEEPELFQHPSQARVFARILRELSESGGYQVAYATHSPYFIEPRYFDQVRRLTLRTEAGSGMRRVAVHQVSLDVVVDQLDGLVKVDGIKSRWPQVCTENLAEALFAEAVVVVEGTGDTGVIEGLARRNGGAPLEDLGVVVADAHGKASLLTPVAILRGLGIPLIAVYDSDSGVAARVARKDNGQAYVDGAVESNATTNLAILKYFGEPTTDALVCGQVTEHLFALDDTLETVLKEWPEWEEHRKALITEGRGAPGKNSATYVITTAEAPGTPPPILIQIIEAARLLVTPPPVARESAHG